ncbi:hypothetical protein OSTOST_21060, partial [Ostertagia ostertagi]
MALDALVTFRYVDEFCGVNELPDKLLKYAITLVQLASASEDQREVTSFLEVAHQALKTIQFIVSHLASTCDEENRSFVTGCTSILNFIMERRRENAICKDELVWYTNREKQMATDRKDPNIEDFAAYCRCFFEQGTSIFLPLFQSGRMRRHLPKSGNLNSVYLRAAISDVLVVNATKCTELSLPAVPPPLRFANICEHATGSIWGIPSILPFCPAYFSY